MTERFSAPRCKSVLYYKHSDGGFQKLRCGAVAGHFPERLHVAFTPDRIRVSWTNKDAEESKKATVEKRTKPFVGWRCWRIHATDEFQIKESSDPTNYSLSQPKTEYKLLSMSAGYVWESPVGTTKEGERLSRDTLHHGIYSYKTPMLMLKYLGLLDSVAGRMDITGHVIEHEYGFRSQFSMIRELWLFEQSRTRKELERIRPDLEDRYQCPVHVVKNGQFKHWAEYMTHEYGEENR